MGEHEMSFGQRQLAEAWRDCKLIERHAIETMVGKAPRGPLSESTKAVLRALGRWIEAGGDGELRVPSGLGVEDLKQVAMLMGGIADDLAKQVPGDGMSRVLWGMGLVVLECAAEIETAAARRAMVN